MMALEDFDAKVLTGEVRTPTKKAQTRPSHKDGPDPVAGFSILGTTTRRLIYGFRDMDSTNYDELSRLRDDFRHLVRIADVGVRR